MNKYTALVEWYWQEHLKYTKKNLSNYHFVHHKLNMDRPGIKPGPPWWKACDYLLSHHIMPSNSITVSGKDKKNAACGYKNKLSKKMSWSS